MDPATLKMVLQISQVLGRSRMVRGVAAAAVTLTVCLGVATAATPVVALRAAASTQQYRAQLGDVEWTLTDPGCGVSVSPGRPAAGFTAEQISIAHAAAQLADQRELPARAKLVILVTGFQESGIRNLDYGDRDSVGWLQQRPSQGWGTVAQLRDPVYAAGKFYDALVKVRGWEQLPLTVAAQRVQISGYPDAYAKHEPAARLLLKVLGDAATPGCEAPEQPQGGGPVPATFDQQGNPRTVEQAVAWIEANAPAGAPGEPVLNRCERYMNLAYGLGGGYPTAIGHWNAAGPRHAGADGNPPRGSLVFWRSANPAGHVALSLGGGIVASTDYNPTTHQYEAGIIGIGPIADIDAWGPRLGWRAPNFQVGSGR